MSRPELLWERLVNAALRRDRTGGVAGGQQGSNVGYVPSSLANNRDIDAILRAADEIQDEDPNIARILCEHGYSLAQNLDPNNEGRGVLQFKTELMSVIKKLSRSKSLWERLVNAALRRERTGGVAAGGQQGSNVGYVPSSLANNKDIDAILRAADEIQGEDPNIARILCEHGYSLAQNLDPNSEGREVLQFKTGLMLVIKQKIAEREFGTIDRSQDIPRLQEFYRLYREKNNVDKWEKQLRESGAFTDVLELKTVKRKRVFATLKVLGSVLEQLAKEIPEELKHVIDSDAAMSEDTIAYNIIPLDAPVTTNATGAFPEKLSRAESLWERLVNAALRRDRTGGVAGGQQGSNVGYVPSSLANNRDIDAILRAADEIQGEDPSIARILCEHGYSLAQNLDPNSKGREVLQFKTGLMLVIKQKIAKREVGTIDRSQDIPRLQEFYRLYREKNNVDKWEKQLRESGAFTDVLELKTVKRKRVFATLKVLGSVLEQLAKEIPEELKHVIDSDAAMSEDTIAYNIIPLAPVTTNATTAFPEKLSRA